eukprot:scaffold3502_cov183-Amphora_coffeaeformis.AAC.8
MAHFNSMYAVTCGQHRDQVIKKATIGRRIAQNICYEQVQGIEPVFFQTLQKALHCRMFSHWKLEKGRKHSFYS